MYELHTYKHTQSDMDSVFQLSNGDRVRYLRNLMHSFGCSYICLWTYSPHLNILCCEDGHFQLEASSSTSGVSIAQTLFNDYKQCVINVGNSVIPGLAFRDKNPCLELNELDLHSLSYSKSQRQFYQEAKIKTALFLASERGEIELGMSNIIPKPQKVETKMQSEIMGMKGEIPRVVRGRDNQEEGEEQCLSGSGRAAFSFPFPFPSAESTDEALTKAYLAILSSSSPPPCSSSSSSSSSSQRYALPPLIINASSSRERSAFTGYHHHEMAATIRRRPTRPTSLFKRAVAFYRGIHFRNKVAANLQWQDFTAGPSSGSGGNTRPSSNQLHHMISERKRREKINDSFQALRSLLPQPTKKDKATVLRSTKEYLSLLKAQVSDLTTKNQELEAKLKETTSPCSSCSLPAAAPASVSSSSGNENNETLSIQLIPHNNNEESTSSTTHHHQTLLFDLRLVFRREASLVPDLLITLLPFLKHHTTTTTLLSINTQTHHHQPSLSPHHHLIPPTTATTTTLLTFRLAIAQGVEWDESAFIEAIRRLLADFIG